MSCCCRRKRRCSVCWSGAPGLDEVLEHSDTINKDEFDLVIPLMSLPRIFGTTLNTIPRSPRYLSAPPAASAAWRQRLTGDDLRVGLVWAGARYAGEDFNRSAALNDFAALAAVSGVTFYSLQKGEEAQQAAQPPAGLRLVDWSAELDDFADTAALIENLDLVISVDTSVVHLAGALGKPTWTLLPQVPEWRWLLERSDSPWYPGMRLFRQSRPGDWAGVVRQVAAELQAVQSRRRAGGNLAGR